MVELLNARGAGGWATQALAFWAMLLYAANVFSMTTLPKTYLPTCDALAPGIDSTAEPSARSGKSDFFDNSNSDSVAHGLRGRPEHSVPSTLGYLGRKGNAQTHQSIERDGPAVKKHCFVIADLKSTAV